MEYTAGNVYKAIDMLAPFGGCMAWDNVGLLVGEPDSAVTGILVTLDVTPAAVAQALEMRMNCIVSHHPIIFHPLKRISARDAAGLCLANGISVISAHTNYDFAPRGVNCALAQTLGLRNIRPFGPEDKEKPWYSIIVFVPKSHAEAVYRTMSEAGAGRQGNYSGCAYMNDGEGRFLPEAGAHPYLGKVGALEKAEEDECVARLESGDDAARRELIEHNLRLVVYISKRFENTGINIEDLISIGTIGLIKAVNTFNSGKKIKLATYASRCIENEILMYLRKISSQRTEVSFDEPLNTDWDGNELLLSDILGTDEDEVSRPLEDDADRQMLMAAIDCLNEREKTIILMRFGLSGSGEYTQKEVADMMGISQSYISRLEKKIIDRLRREMLRQMQC